MKKAKRRPTKKAQAEGPIILGPMVGSMTDAFGRQVLEYLLEYDEGPRKPPEGITIAPPPIFSPAWALENMQSSIAKAHATAPWLPFETKVPPSLRCICLKENWWSLFRQIMREREHLVNEDWDSSVRVNLVLKYAESRTISGMTMFRRGLSLQGSITAYYLLGLAANIYSRKPMLNTQGCEVSVENQTMILGATVAKHLMEGQCNFLTKLLTEAHDIGYAALQAKLPKIGKIALPSDQPMISKISEKNGGVQQAIWLNFRQLVNSGCAWASDGWSELQRADFKEEHGLRQGVIPSHQQLFKAVEISRPKVKKRAFDEALQAVGLGFLKVSKKK